MVIRCTKNFNSNPAEMTPGLHVDAAGKRHPPIGTLYQMLERARFGNPPTPWNEKTQDRFIATLQADPLFRQAIREVFRVG